MNLGEEIIAWYEIHKRTLPWRNTIDPYRIWLSEIILQQTRVEQGLPYYEKFIDKFPRVQSLAAASEQQVLKLWQGLGYYSRARNLYHTAKTICHEYAGIFPRKYEDIRKLKGIGEYTAAAIASFAYNEAYPVLDGNVFRLLSRLHGIDAPVDSGAGKKIFREAAKQMMNGHEPRIYNQAVMEFGAIQCKPVSPNCGNCPLNYMCYAFQNKIVAELPVKSKKQKVRQRYFNYIVLHNHENVLLTKRAEKGIWANLYEFPLIESEKPMNEQELGLSAEFLKLMPDSRNVTFLGSLKRKQQLTHQSIHAVFWKFYSQDICFINNSVIFEAEIKRLNQYPVHRMIDNYVTNFF